MSPTTLQVTEIIELGVGLRQGKERRVCELDQVEEIVQVQGGCREGEPETEIRWGEGETCKVPSGYLSPRSPGLYGALCRDQHRKLREAPNRSTVKRSVACGVVNAGTLGCALADSRLEETFH